MHERQQNNDEKFAGSRNVNASGNDRIQIATGDGNLQAQRDINVYYELPAVSNDELVSAFRRHTERELQLIKPEIPGLGEVLIRDEVGVIEASLAQGKPVLLTGWPVVGKVI